MGIYALLLALHITSKYEEKYEPNPQAVLLLFTASALSGAVTFIKIQLLIWECQNTILFALQILHHPAGFLGYVFAPNSFYLFTFFFISWYKAIYVSPFFIDKVKKNKLVPWMHFTWFFFFSRCFPTSSNLSLYFCSKFSHFTQYEYTTTHT